MAWVGYPCHLYKCQTCGTCLASLFPILQLVCNYSPGYCSGRRTTFDLRRDFQVRDITDLFNTVIKPKPSHGSLSWTIRISRDERDLWIVQRKALPAWIVTGNHYLPLMRQRKKTSFLRCCTPTRTVPTPAYPLNENISISLFPIPS